MEHSAVSRITIVPTSSAESLGTEKRRLKGPRRFKLLCRISRWLASTILLNQTIIIEQFPVSLDVLTTFFRFFGFSFSGCRFVEHSSLYQIDNKKFALTDWRYTLKQASKRWLGLLLNVAFLFVYLAPFLNFRLGHNVPVHYANSTVNGHNYTAVRFEDFSHFIVTILQGITSNDADLDQLKPILRMIMQWLLMVFMFNGFFVILFNLLFGGAFIRHLIGIAEFAELDASKGLARRLLAATFAVILTIKLFCMWMYQADLFKLFFTADNDKYDPQFMQIRQPVMLQNFLAELLITTAHYYILSMTSLLFIYCMAMFRRSIEQMQTELVSSQGELDELQLTLLKTRLYRLNDAFKSTVNFFAVPISLELVAGCYYLIACVCFLIINSDKGIRPYAIAFIANIGIFALVRLVVVSSAGNLPTNASTTLVRVLYEAKVEWTLGEWLAYVDIKRAPVEFAVSVFSIFSVQQSSILTMLGFALNYIVILLQTENYGSQGQNGTATNATG